MNFSFSKTSTRKEVFNQQVCQLLNFMETYYDLQIDNTSQILSKYEKLTKTYLKNQPEIKVIKKEEKKVEEKKPDIIEKIDQDILNTITKAEEVLKIAEEKPKPGFKKDPPPQTSSTSTTIDPKASDKRPGSRSNSSLGLKRTSGQNSEEKLQKANPRTPVDPSRASTIDGKILKRVPHYAMPKQSTQAQATQQPQPKFTPTNPNRGAKPPAIIEKPEKTVVENNQVVSPKNQAQIIFDDSKPFQGPIKKEEVKLTKQTQPSVEEKKENVDKEIVEDAPLRILASFAKKEKLFSGENKLKKFAQKKKEMNEKLKGLKENLKYFEEKESKSKTRFMDKLHMNIDHCTQVWGPPSETKVYESMKVDNKDLAILDPRMGKSLLVAQNLLKSIKSAFDFTNIDIEAVINYDELLNYEEEDEFIPKMIKLFRTWFMINRINESIEFIKEDITNQLSSKNVKEVLIAAKAKWKDTCYFTTLENKQKSKKKTEVSASWFDFKVKNSPQTLELALVKKSTKIKGNSESDRCLVDLYSSRIEFMNFESCVLKIMHDFWKERYGPNAAKENDKKMSEYLKVLRTLFVLTKGNLHQIPMFMKHIES